MVTDQGFQKRCSKCGETKPVEMFSGNGRLLYCKLCESSSNFSLSKGLDNALSRFDAAQQVLATGMKLCSKCGQTKPVDMFAGNGREKDGFHKRCKACVSAKLQIKDLAYYKQHGRADQGKQQSNFEIPSTLGEGTMQILDYRNKLGQGYQEGALETLRANAEKRRQEKRAYRRDLAREIKQQRAQARREAKHIFVSRNRTKYQRRKALLKANGGSHTKAEIKALCEAQNHQCAYCKRKVKLTEDHIIPVTKGGSDYISNICMACWRCNHQKRARTPEQWVKRWYLEES